MKSMIDCQSSVIDATKSDPAGKHNSSCSWIVNDSSSSGHQFKIIPYINLWTNKWKIYKYLLTVRIFRHKTIFDLESLQLIATKDDHSKLENCASRYFQELSSSTTYPGRFHNHPKSTDSFRSYILYLKTDSLSVIGISLIYYIIHKR